MGRASRKKKERTIETPLQGENSAAKHETTGFLTSPVMAIILLSILAFLIYSNTFSVPFLFDDNRNIVDNPQIKYLKNFLDLSGTRYVGFLTFAMNYAVGGLNVVGYHLVNLLIHIVNGVLVYSFVLLLFQTADHERRLPAGGVAIAAGDEPRVASHAHLIALTTALLFIAHPIQTQAVTYIVQRLASLVTVFYLLTVICYLKWRLSPERTTKNNLWYVAALLSCVLAMKTKENSFTIPLMIILIEGIFCGAVTLTKRRWWPVIPFLLTFLIIPFSRGDIIGDTQWFASDKTPLSRPDYFFTQFRVIVTYLRLLVWPANQNLDYDYPVYHSLLDPPVFISFLFLSSLLGFAVYILRRTPAFKILAFGILWFFLTLSVESSVVPINDVIYEHRVYLPSVGFFLGISFLAAWGGKRWPGMKLPILLFVFVVIGGISIATYERNRMWQDPEKFWKDVVRKSPEKPRPHMLLGMVYEDMERFDGAIAEYQTALQLKPDYAEDAANLANIYGKQGRFDDAIGLYKKVIEIIPDYGEIYNNLGIVYSNQGRLDEAVETYRKGLSIGRDLDRMHFNLGNAYVKGGRVEEALEEYKTAIHLKPERTDYRYVLANTYVSQNRMEEAAAEYKAIVKLDPNNAEAHNNLGNCAILQNRYEEAIREYREALRLKPDFATARNNLGIAIKKAGEAAKQK